MKKLLSIFALCSVALTGCVDFAEDAPVKLDDASAPVISNVETDDESFSAKVSVSGDNITYFSYAVIEGEAEELSASDLLKNLYKGDAETSGVCKTKDSTFVNVYAEDLTPNMPYTIYAVACTADGVVSEIVTKTKVTSDSTIPEIDDADSEVDDEGVMWLYAEFDDPVELTGEGKAEIYFYAKNYNASPVASYSIEAEEFELDGQWLCVPVSDTLAQPGAYVFMTLSEGIVVNGVGGKNEAFSVMEFDPEDEDNNEGIWGRYDTEKWELSIGDGSTDPEGKYIAWEDTTIMFNDPEAFEYIVFPSDDAVVPSYEENAIIRYTYETGNGRVVSYNYNTSDYIPLVNPIYDFMAAYLPEAPDFGATVSLSIAEGVYEDQWGNQNAALDAKDIFFLSYGYTLDDITGTYTFNAFSYYAGSQPEAEVVIAPIEGVEDSVYVYGLFDSITCCDDFDYYETWNTVFKAGVDFNCGTLTFDPDAIGFGVIEAYEWENAVLAMTVKDGDLAGFVMNIPEAGTIELAEEVSIYCNGLGTWDYIEEISLDRTSTTYSIPEPPVAGPVAARGWEFKSSDRKLR